MTPNFYSYYDVGVPFPGKYVEILNSDKAIYGGYNQYNGAPLIAQEGWCQDQHYHVTIKLTSFAAIYLLRVTEENSNTQEVAKVSGEDDNVLKEVLNGGDVKIYVNKNKSIG